jgi:hypothetical protein
MAHINNAVQRTAPIPIAPKPLAPRPEPATHRQPESFRRFEIGPSSLHARDSVSASAPTPSNGQSLPPCRACRYAGSRCIPSEDDQGCISCQVNADDCSLSSSPQSRKRKLNGDTAEVIGKKRFVTLICPVHLCLVSLHFIYHHLRQVSIPMSPSCTPLPAYTA